MKLMFKSFVCMLAVVTSAQGFAREAVETQNQSSTNEDLTKLDAAKLAVRLGWAKLYLADLEKNDSVMGAIGIPVEKSPTRTAYAVGVTAVNASVIGATYALVHKAIKKNQHGRSVMNAPGVQAYRQANVQYATQIKETQGAAKLGIMPTKLDAAGKTVGAGPSSAELIGNAKQSIEINKRGINDFKVAAKYTTLNRVVRAAGITLGVGIVATLVYDGVRTWFQVQHNGEQVEEQKQNLRDFIAYAEDRLSREDGSAQSETASAQDAR